MLSFEGTIRVDGRVEGEVLSKDTLIAGDEAYLQGEISVGTIIRIIFVFGQSALRLLRRRSAILQPRGTHHARRQRALRDGESAGRETPA